MKINHFAQTILHLIIENNKLTFLAHKSTQHSDLLEISTFRTIIKNNVSTQYVVSPPFNHVPFLTPILYIHSTQQRLPISVTNGKVQIIPTSEIKHVLLLIKVVKQLKVLHTVEKMIV